MFEQACEQEDISDICITIVGKSHINLDFNHFEDRFECENNPTPLFTTMSLHDVIDFEQYPIHNLNTTAAKNLIAICQAKMKSDGSLLLEGFIQQDVIQKMCTEVNQFRIASEIGNNQCLEKRSLGQQRSLSKKLTSRSSSTVHYASRRLCSRQ